MRCKALHVQNSKGHHFFAWEWWNLLELEIFENKLVIAQCCCLRDCLGAAAEVTIIGAASIDWQIFGVKARRRNGVNMLRTSRYTHSNSMAARILGRAR